MGNEKEPRGAENQRIEEHLGELETQSPPEGLPLGGGSTESTYKPEVANLKEGAYQQSKQVEALPQSLDDLVRGIASGAVVEVWAQLPPIQRARVVAFVSQLEIVLTGLRDGQTLSSIRADLEFLPFREEMKRNELVDRGTFGVAGEDAEVDKSTRFHPLPFDVEDLAEESRASGRRLCEVTRRVLESGILKPE